MPFQPPQNSLLPLLLQHTLNQRSEQEARQLREDQIAQQRAESALDVAVRALSQGVSADEAISLAGPDFPADRIKGIKGIERARKQQQKTQEEQGRIGPAAEGLASQLGNIQSGAAPPQSLATMLESLQGSFSPESISAISTEGQSRLAANQARTREGRPVPFYDNATGAFRQQARPGTPEYEQLASNKGLISYEPQGTPEQVFGQRPGEDKVIRREAQKNLADTIGRARQTGQLLRTISNADPRAFGIRSLLANRVGQVLAAADPADPTLRNQVTQAIAGASPQELRDLTLQSQMMIGASVPAIVGDNSGRYTDVEQSLAREALSLVGPGATQVDARTAMELMHMTYMLNASSFSMRAAMKPQHSVLKFNPKTGETTPDIAGRKKLVEAAAKEGLSDSARLRLVELFEEQQRNLYESGVY